MKEFNALKREAGRFGAMYIKELTKQLLMADKKASGKLIRSLSYDLVEDINGLMIKVQAAPYLKYVDGGRRPGKMPPVKAILKWMDNRRIKARDKKTGRFMKKEEVAFLIARSIGRRGIHPTRVINKAMTTVFQQKKSLLARAGAQDVESAIDKMLVDILKQHKK